MSLALRLRQQVANSCLSHACEHLGYATRTEMHLFVRDRVDRDVVGHHPTWNELYGVTMLTPPGDGEHAE